MPRVSAILDADGRPFEVDAPSPQPRPRYRSHPGWLPTRHWEAAETNRLNEAHWSYAQDTAINSWLAQNLSTIRARSIYESRQNGMIAGVIRTHADDIVGPDGPTLQVQSDDDDYNDALEAVWKDWWAAPTLRPNVSGSTLLKLWIFNLWRCGEYVCRIYIDPDAEGPVAMRLWPAHPRRLKSPMDRAGDPNVVMGVEFDQLERPIAYYIEDVALNGQAAMSMRIERWLANSIIHEFILDEEGQARGFPWCTPALNPASELRDYDDQTLDAARLQADQGCLLYTDHPDSPFWNAPESTNFERRTIRSIPPGWKPWMGQVSQPPAVYTDYRAERQREIGRPVGMPLMMIRLDASRHNYSSARLDTQCYDRGVAGIQIWFSGSEHSYGMLNRLVDEVVAEARYSVRELRRRPARVVYLWTWPKRPHVDPAKEGTGEAIGLQNLTVLLSEALAARGKNLETHVAKLKRELELLKDLPIPAQWLQNPTALLAMLAAENNPNTGAPADGQTVASGA